MSHMSQLNAAGYEATKRKLADMKTRLQLLLSRTDLSPVHFEGVKHSYEDMIRQYSWELKRYEQMQQRGTKEKADAQNNDRSPYRRLTARSYEATKKKLARLERRLEVLLARTDLDPTTREDKRYSYEEVIRKYRRELKLYEYRQRTKKAKGSQGKKATLKQRPVPRSM